MNPILNVIFVSCLQVIIITNSTPLSIYRGLRMHMSSSLPGPLFLGITNVREESFVLSLCTYLPKHEQQDCRP